MKNNNKQKFNNKQNNINISAWWDVNNWIINNQVDNSRYNISKEDTTLFDSIWKYIISKLWEKWGIFSSILLIIWWLITSIVNWINYFTTLKVHIPEIWEGFNIEKILSSFTLEWFLIILGFILIFLWVFIYRSIEHKNNRECPQCKKPYSLIEVWTPKEKELKTSKWYRVTQIRNYKCKNCGYKKTEEVNFLEPLKES